jgi:hypothetical protein
MGVDAIDQSICPEVLGMIHRNLDGLYRESLSIDGLRHTFFSLLILHIILRTLPI